MDGSFVWFVCLKVKGLRLLVPILANSLITMMTILFLGMRKRTVSPTYYSDGTARYRTLSGFEYSTGGSSWIDNCGIEHRNDGTESRPVWWNDNLREVYDSSTNELLGIEREEAWGISRY